MSKAAASLQLPKQRRYLAFILEGVQDGRKAFEYGIVDRHEKGDPTAAFRVDVTSKRSANEFCVHYN